MVRPVSFRMNEETAVNNYYQHDPEDLSSRQIQSKALIEFDNFVAVLREHGVKVIVVEDILQRDTPDSIFPNNWITFHHNGTVGIYPMFAENRRLERREDILVRLEEEGYIIEQVIDYTSAEEEGLFLEATGSLVLDRDNRIAYCALSARADEELLIEFCEDFEYTPVIFHAYQTVEGKRELIYHTNVMMAVTLNFVIVCLNSIDDTKERKNFVEFVRNSGKQILEISEEQVEHFAGNMLQVMGQDGQPLTVMSGAAYRSLSTDQIEKLESEAKIVYSDLNTIETCGGGSARCMMAEVFLKSKHS